MTLFFQGSADIKKVLKMKSQRAPDKSFSCFQQANEGLVQPLWLILFAG
jgi:hypothetical protein